MKRKFIISGQYSIEGYVENNEIKIKNAVYRPVVFLGNIVPIIEFQRNNHKVILISDFKINSGCYKK